MHVNIYIDCQSLGHCQGIYCEKGPLLCMVSLWCWKNCQWFLFLNIFCPVIQVSWSVVLNDISFVFKWLDLCNWLLFVYSFKMFLSAPAEGSSHLSASPVGRHTASASAPVLHQVGLLIGSLCSRWSESSSGASHSVWEHIKTQDTLVQVYKLYI